MKDINRIKVELIEKNKQANGCPNNQEKILQISKRGTNTSQPDLVTLTKVTALLDVDACQLINKTKGINTDD